jgi:hypothetical protein
MTDNYPSEPYPASGTGVTGVTPATTPPPAYGTTDTLGTTDSTSDSSVGSAKDTAKEQAANVGQTAASSAKDVASTAKEEATKVASTAKRQAKDLVHETRSQLSEQAGAQQQKVASGLHSLSDELRGMADSSSEPGIASDLVSQVASRAGSVATWLEDRDPGSLLEEFKGFARRKPGTFIAVAAVAGVLAGRLTRSLVTEAKESAEAADSTPVATTDTYTTPTTDTYGVAPTTPVYGSTGYGAATGEY